MAFLSDLQDKWWNSVHQPRWFPPVPWPALRVPVVEKQPHPAPSWTWALRSSVSQPCLHWHQLWPPRYNATIGNISKRAANVTQALANGLLAWPACPLRREAASSLTRLTALTSTNVIPAQVAGLSAASRKPWRSFTAFLGICLRRLESWPAGFKRITEYDELVCVHTVTFTAPPRRQTSQEQWLQWEAALANAFQNVRQQNMNMHQPPAL